VLENKNKGSDRDKLQPLSKEEALASMKKFRKDLGLEGIHTDKDRIQSILQKSGLLSDEVTSMRREQDI
jgi:hypothetical protein